jgi:hypothetical protein
MSAEITNAPTEAELDELEVCFSSRRVRRLIAAYRESQAEVRRLKAENTQLRLGCPFDKVDFQCQINEPCPICGGTGEDGAEDKCVLSSTTRR